MKEVGPLRVCERCVTLQYLLDLNDALQTGVLVKGKELHALKGMVGYLGRKGQTVTVVKMPGILSKGIVKVDQEEVQVSIGQLTTKKRTQWTMDDVLEYVVKEAVEEPRLPLAETLDPKRTHPKPYQGHFVSIPTSVWFNGVIEALRSHFENQDPDKVHLFLNITNMDPFGTTYESLTAWYSTMEQCMRRFSGEHLVYFDGWGAASNTKHRDNVSALKEAGCMWEIYCAGRVGKRTQVIMRDTTRGEFNQSLRGGGLQYFEDTLAGIALPPSESFNVDQVVGAGAPGGGKKVVLRVIRNQLDLWFVREFAKQKNRIIQKRDIRYDQAGEDLNRIAVLHSRVGDLETAAVLFADVVGLQEKGRGRSDPAVALAKNNLAMVLRKQGKLRDAAKLLEEAIEILENTRQDDKALKATQSSESLRGTTAHYTAILVSNLAGVLEALEEWPAAEVQRSAAVALWEEAMGTRRCAKVGAALNNLGALRMRARKADSAREALLESLSICEQLHDQKTEEQVIENLALSYEVDEEEGNGGSGKGGSSKHHLDLVNTLKSLAILYRVKESSVAKAEQYEQRGLEILSNVLGEDHEEVRRYKDDILEFDQEMEEE